MNESEINKRLQKIITERGIDKLAHTHGPALQNIHCYINIMDTLLH